MSATAAETMMAAQGPEFGYGPLVAEKLPPYLKVAHAARILQRTPQTLLRWIAEGKLQGRRVGGRQWLVLTDDILQLLQG